jgi:hypothetical protein
MDGWMDGWMVDAMMAMVKEGPPLVLVLAGSSSRLLLLWLWRWPTWVYLLVLSVIGRGYDQILLRDGLWDILWYH